MGQAMPFPPQTWADLSDIARYFNGRNWDEADPDPDYGLVMPLGDAPQLVRQFVAVSGPFVVQAGQPTAPCNSYWFNPTTLTPFPPSEGHLRGLERFLELAQAGPSEQLTFERAEAAEAFLRGKAVFTLAGAELGALLQDPTRSLLQGSWGVSSLPGAAAVYDLCTSAWLEGSAPNRIGNSLGDAWQGVALAASPNREAAYSLFALTATKPVHAWSLGQPWNLAPSLRLDQGGYRPEAWPADLLGAYLSALQQSLYEPSQAPELRLAGAQQYRELLAEELRDALLGRLTPHEALDRSAQDWQALSEELGLQAQLEQYRTSLGLEPIPSP
jgi:multiple sugar transport system substrate-binding protein